MKQQREAKAICNSNKVKGKKESFKRNDYQGVVSLSLGLGLLNALTLNFVLMALALKAGRGHQALDLGGFEVGLLLSLKKNKVRNKLSDEKHLDDLAADNELADIVLLAKVEQGLDLGGALGAQSAGLDGVSQSLDLGLSLADHH